MQFPNSSREQYVSALEKYYSMEDTKRDLMFTNTTLGDRVYVELPTDTSPELLNLCKIVQALMIVPISDLEENEEYWYMLERAVLSPRGELYLQYSAHFSFNACHPLPVYAYPISPFWAYHKFAFPIDIKNIESLELWAKTLQAMVKEGSLSELETYLGPAEAHTMVAVHATGRANAKYLHPAHTTDLAAECVQRGMWSLLKVLTNGYDVEEITHHEAACTIWYYCPGYGLVSQVETDEVTKKPYYREVIRWVAEDDS
ncbi:hypothetical protein EDD85DRAFT_868865 [Armillaria nabsnona]|nr:hypothetical protein EDD85DRAFT_868865 [Armillaria nabsnona]